MHAIRSAVTKQKTTEPGIKKIQEGVRKLNLKEKNSKLSLIFMYHYLSLHFSMHFSSESCVYTIRNSFFDTSCLTSDFYQGRVSIQFQFQFQFQFQCPLLTSELNNIGKASKASLCFHPSLFLHPSPHSLAIFNFQFLEISISPPINGNGI